MERTTQLYQHYLNNPVVCTDSRSVTAGSIFFALKGDSFNGNRYAEGALNSGAVLAVVDEPGVVTDERFFLVEDVLTTLQDLARLHRSHFKGPVIGITGTNGKTTTKELINAVLSERYRTHATQGNLNNHIGVPLTILSADLATTDLMIIEMGANHPGEIAFLCNIARPDFGLITNVGKAHLEGFGSLEGVINTKTELYRFLKSVEGKAFVCSGQQALMQHAATLEYLSYGKGNDDYCQGEMVSSDPFLKVRWFDHKRERLIQTNLVGAYNVDNVLAAVCLGKYFEVSPDQVVAAIEKYTPSNNRSQVLQTASNQIILDAYNANPSSMRVALENFALMNSNHKVTILGDMFELGADSRTEHEAIVTLLKGFGFDEVLLIGPRFGEVSSGSGFRCFDTTDNAYEWLVSNPIKQSSILVKGSRGMKLEKLIPAISDK